MQKLFLALIIFTVILHYIAASDFGYFDIAINFVKKCQGPKHQECCDFSIKLNDTSTYYEMDVKENVIPSKAKVMATPMVKNKPTLRLQMNKPCEHIFIKPFFTTLFNATKSCTILQGHYKFSIDLGDIFKKYYGGQFFYGNWTFKSIIYGEKTNFMCNDIGVEFYPAKKLPSKL